MAPILPTELIERFVVDTSEQTVVTLLGRAQGSLHILQLGILLLVNMSGSLYIAQSPHQFKVQNSVSHSLMGDTEDSVSSCIPLDRNLAAATVWHLG